MMIGGGSVAGRGKSMYESATAGQFDTHQEPKEGSGEFPVEWDGPVVREWIRE